jgi:biopolymer transport protein ExbB
MDSEFSDFTPAPPPDAPDQLNALLVQLQQDATQAMDAGGPIGVLLALMSVVALSLFILKIWQFSSLRLGRRRFITRTVDLHTAGDDEAALTLLHQTKNPVARVMEATILGLRRSDINPNTVREDVIRIADEALRDLRSHIRGLEVIASLSPLLGLLGTVLGMIAVFSDIAGADSRVSPALLSGGIWEALLTTAIGMTVAIPTIVAINWLEAKTEGVSADMESAITRLFTADICRLEKPRSGKPVNVSVSEFNQAAE